jgi:GT2 family glycosyltransferase
VVDSGSTCATAAALSEFPSVHVIRFAANVGAAGRNAGVTALTTPFVAFSDDDTAWEPGSLGRAAELLTAFPRVAVITARIEVNGDRRVDPTSLVMRRSQMQPPEPLPGPMVLGFMAGACVMRTSAFYDVGGYWPPFFIGGEEALMALDLVERGWRIVYADDVITRHFPSLCRDSRLRERLLIRNAIWVAWMRRPLRAAWHETSVQWRAARERGIAWPTMVQMVLGLPRALRYRKVVSPAVESMRALLDIAAANPGTPASQNSDRSTA